MQIFGGMGQAKASAEAAKISKDEAAQEEGINTAKRQQMELEARRTQLENVRNNQRARAMATNSAVNQGAQFGSGLQGGLAQVDAQTDYNMFGVNSALQTGRAISGFNSKISADKMQMADVQSQGAEAAGLSSLGGALIKNSGFVGQLSQGFGNVASKAGSAAFGVINSGGMLFQ
jgi:hypothetical protein